MAVWAKAVTTKNYLRHCMKSFKSRNMAVKQGKFDVAADEETYIGYCKSSAYRVALNNSWTIVEIQSGKLIDMIEKEAKITIGKSCMSSIWEISK